MMYQPLNTNAYEVDIDQVCDYEFDLQPCDQSFDSQMIDYQQI